MSDPSDDANRWSWVTPDGKTVTGAKGELMLALRGEKLPASTLVCRGGWAEWLPAARVAELRNVLPPGKAEPAQAPKLTETAAGRAQASGAAALSRAPVVPRMPSPHISCPRRPRHPRASPPPATSHKEPCTPL